LVDWSKLPDIAAVALLTAAFASVARRGQSSLSSLWLLGWVMIMLHFAAFLFLPIPGPLSELASFVALATLASAGVLFMWAAVPFRHQLSSLWMLVVLLGTNTLYVGLLVIDPIDSWALALAALLIGALPLAIALFNLRRFNHPLRWFVVGLYASLSVFLLTFERRPGNGGALALNAILFTVYFGCSIHFWYAYRRATTGAFITIAGFFAWASVFVAAPLLGSVIPNLHLESEVWNLPKYVVAVGMILLLLEDQIEECKYLALHDELTGLPNRRLFQDRLNNALIRARRTGSQVALMLVDLDDFKQVNDTVGHHAGDTLLKHVGELFTGRVRRSDTVARTGGDEFSVILEEPMTRADAVRVAKSLSDLLDNSFEIDGQMVHVGASVGVAVFPDDAPDAESLCIAADLRMYAGKTATKASLVDQAQPVFLPTPHPVRKAQRNLQTAE
jgi:diguanylate cyclase (GGDEF)-like protein